MLKNKIIFCWLNFRNYAVPASNRFLLTLRFYVTGSILMTLADFSGVSVSTALNICLIGNSSIIYFERQTYLHDKKRSRSQGTKSQFSILAWFSCIVGAIDCSLIRIKSPGGDQAEYYRSRKMYFSLNVQTIYDPNLKILDIVTRW